MNKFIRLLIGNILIIAPVQFAGKYLGIPAYMYILGSIAVVVGINLLIFDYILATKEAQNDQH
jgi:small basic protein